MTICIKRQSVLLNLIYMPTLLIVSNKYLMCINWIYKKFPKVSA